MITPEGSDPGDPRLAVCGARSPSGRMRCEHPPDHRYRFGEAGVAEYHYGRDQRGQWRSWAMKNAREDQILTLRQQGLTHDAIAAAIGISSPRVSQIFAEARKRRPDLTPPDDTFTTAEAAKVLGLSTAHVAGLARDGRIAATRFAGRWHIDAVSVTAYAETHPDPRTPTEEATLMPEKKPTLKNTLISAAYDALDDDRYITCAAMCQLIEQLQTDEALTTPAPWDEAPRYRRGLMSLDGDLAREAREARGKPAVRLDAPPDEDHPGDCMCYRCMDEAQENEDES